MMGADNRMRSSGVPRNSLGARRVDPTLGKSRMSKPLHRRISASFLSAALIAACHRPATLAPVEQLPPGDWPSYGRTLAGDRFSPLAQINRTNVTRLAQVCEYVLADVAALQTGPLVVDGTMYFTTDTISYAIDGATCQEKWRSPRHSGRNASLVHRGFAWLDGRLFRGTTDGHVLALAAADGRTIWDQT